jgi:hypothetical protein
VPPALFLALILFFYGCFFNLKDSIKTDRGLFVV